MNNHINIYSLLTELERRPAMFLGNDYTFQSLDSFITGFICGCDDEQLTAKDCNNFSDFNFWIIGHLPKHFGSSGGWYWQLKNRSLNNNVNAFKEFFDFLNIFKQDKKIITTIEINPKTIEYTYYPNKTGDGIQDFKEVKALEKVEFKNSKTIFLNGFEDNKKKVYSSWHLTETEFEEELKQFKLKE